MKSHLKIKRKALIITEIICLIIAGIFLFNLQGALSLSQYNKDLKQEISQFEELINEANQEKEESTKTFDEIYKSKAESIAFLANNNVSFQATDTKMKEYKKMLDVDNVLILDNKGNIIAKAQDTKANFTYSRYNQLRTVFQDGKNSEAFEVKREDQNYRYYGSKINNEMMVVIEQDPKELYQILEDTTSQKSVFDNVVLGLDGYVFSISAKNYIIEYHPNKNLIGMDAIEAGIQVEDLEDDHYGWIELNDEKYYAGINLIDDYYYLSVIPNSEMEGSRNITVGVILFILFAIMTIVSTYGIFVMDEKDNHEENLDKSKVFFKKYFVHKKIAQKSAILSFVGIIIIFIGSFYMQTLFSLSSVSLSNNQHVSDVEMTMKRYQKQVDTLTEQYNERYLNKAQIAAYMIQNKPELGQRDKLQELADVLQIQDIYVFDKNGSLSSTSSPYTRFELSQDPKDQSYEFNQLLLGVEYLIQKPQKDEGSGEFHQYIGVTLRDENENANGFVQIAIRPTRLETIMQNMQISNILDGVKVGANGFAFAIDKDKGTFAYHPDSRLINRKATEYGVKEKQMVDGFCDYMTIQSQRYYASALETDQYYIYVALPGDEIMTSRMYMSVAATIISAICLFMIFGILTLMKDQVEVVELNDEKVDKDKRNIEVTMADGRKSHSESAASRWMFSHMDWEEKTAEQKIMTVMRWLLGILAIFVCVAVIWKDDIFGRDSIFHYILAGEWQKGINVFAITASIMIISVVMVATTVVKSILQLLATTFGARGETMCRLINSLVKYVSLIAMLYYCFALFGVDTATLLASAGILSIAISLGAKDLVSDIVSGLFIIFEGDFRVGDIIMIGDWRGTVVEIGVRTTKIQDGMQNIKIIRNTNVSDVINMTKNYSYAMCDVGIEYGESLERVELVLEKEFPRLRKELTSIVEGPFYSGVVSLGDNSVNVRIMCMCLESDRISLERDLNRQMKLIFDKYDINIPFPQVVVNQPIEFKEATFLEKIRADQFNKEQKEATKAIRDEDDDDSSNK